MISRSFRCPNDQEAKSELIESKLKYRAVLCSITSLTSLILSRLHPITLDSLEEPEVKFLQGWIWIGKVTSNSLKYYFLLLKILSSLQPKKTINLCFWLVKTWKYAMKKRCELPVDLAVLRWTEINIWREQTRSNKVEAKKTLIWNTLSSNLNLKRKNRDRWKDPQESSLIIKSQFSKDLWNKEKIEVGLEFQNH